MSRVLPGSKSEKGQVINNLTKEVSFLQGDSIEFDSSSHNG